MASVLFVRITSDLEPSNSTGGCSNGALLPGGPRSAAEGLRPRSRDGGRLRDLLLRDQRGAGCVPGDRARADDPDAYEAADVRREVYEVLYPLRPERGPLPVGAAADATSG